MENINTWLAALGHVDLSHLEYQPKVEKVKPIRRSKYHKAVLALYKQGLSNGAIARALGCAKSTVRYVLYSAGISRGLGKGVTLLSPGEERRFSGVSAAARELGLSPAGISKVCNGLQKETRGYIFKWSAE